MIEELWGLQKCLAVFKFAGRGCGQTDMAEFNSAFLRCTPVTKMP
jgi:hypothetical protein